MSHDTAFDVTAETPVELVAVTACVAFARRHGLTRVARFFTRIGNGWLYPAASAAVLLSPLEHAARSIAAAAISIAIAFTIYPTCKRAVRRRRPCDVDPSLGDAIAPLDHYSFPSGHAMTAAAFGLPVMMMLPAATTPVVIGGWLLVSWSRVALGHHYLTDILAGSAIGAAIALCVASAML